LSHWVVDRLQQAGAGELTVLTNSRGLGVPASLASRFPLMTFDFVTADTASSFESFRLVSLRLAARADAFLVSTVDAIIPSDDVARFWEDCRARRGCAGLALTNFVDDENPLWADVDEGGFVTRLGGDAIARSSVTCGLYYMTRQAAMRLPEPSAHARLRDFWRDLVISGEPVAGTILSKTLDVDRPEDVAAADSFLRSRI
jgi:NDP-sugar pyrophosphorylase family protein